MSLVHRLVIPFQLLVCSCLVPIVSNVLYLLCSVLYLLTVYHTYCTYSTVLYLVQDGSTRGPLGWRFSIRNGAGDKTFFSLLFLQYLKLASFKRKLSVEVRLSDIQCLL